MTSIITYDQMKNSYKEFKNNLPKDNFMRYYKEFTFMKSLIEFTKRQGLEDDVFEYQKIQQESAQELRNMGYKVTIEE